MLARLASSIAHNQWAITTTSFRLFSASALRLGDGDHAKSKAKDKASDDLKAGREKRWLDTVASDSGTGKLTGLPFPALSISLPEAAVKGDKQHAAKQGDLKKDMTDLQRDTIDAVKEKERKGHLDKHDVGRRDKRADRVGSGSSDKKQR